MHHSPAERSWFALRVRSRHERIVASALCDKGNEVFLPLYRCERRWSDRIKELELPLFPGYLFCRFDILNRLPILVTPGILHIVGIGRVPYPVDEAELEALKTIVISRLAGERWPLFQVGLLVRIEVVLGSALEAIWV